MIELIEKDIDKIVFNILNKKATIKAIGNHELKRNLVYLLTDDYGASSVLKIYFRKNRRNREIASLNLLEKSSVKCPKIINYGYIKNDTEWLLSEHIEGEPFDKIIHNINTEDKLMIFEQMGEELGKLHSFKKFNFFGNWDECGNSIDNIYSYKEAFIKRAEITINNLLSRELPDKLLHKKSIESLKKMYDILDDVKNSRLCHNDFDGRNILINKKDNIWNLSSVIDFEQCLPWDKDFDLAILFHKYFLNNKEYKESFFKEYKKYYDMNTELDEKMICYLLFIGICICSWAYENANDYYIEGKKILEYLL